MRNNRTIFFIIIGLAVLVTGAILLLEQLGIYTLPSRAVQQIPIQVAVPANMAEWATDVADAFNSRNSDANVTVIGVNGLAAVERFDRTALADRPHAWVPEATFVAAIAEEEGLSYTSTGGSITSTHMSWGAFQSRADALGTVDWSAVHDASAAGNWTQSGGQSNWGFFKLTIASPTNSSEGLAALISASASYHNTNTLTRGLVTDGGYTSWMNETVESVPNFSTLGPDPAETLASRGASVGDVGFLSSAAWERSKTGLNSSEAFVISPARYTVELDYPYLVRNGLETNETDVAERFGQYLQQQNDDLVELGFTGSDSGTPVEIDGPSVIALLRWAERERIGQ